MTTLPTEYQNDKIPVTATIAESASLSGAVELAGCCLVGIVMPAAWTTANLTFQASADGTTYNNLYTDAGVEYAVTAAVDRFIVLDPADFAGIGYVKVRSGTAGTPVAQGAARSLVLVARPV